MMMRFLLVRKVLWRVLKEEVRILLVLIVVSFLGIKRMVFLRERLMVSFFSFVQRSALLRVRGNY
jgi:hypothetical protein